MSSGALEPSWGRLAALLPPDFRYFQHQYRLGNCLVLFWIDMATSWAAPNHLGAIPGPFEGPMCHTGRL